MKARVKWIEKRTFLGESGSGHAIVCGTAHDPDPATPGPSPMELLLIGMGGCSGFDVVHILEKGREPITDCVVELAAERIDDYPRVFGWIKVRYVVTGAGLDPDKVERAVKLSVEKYCAATAMMAKSADVSHEIEIIDTRSRADDNYNR